MREDPTKARAVRRRRGRREDADPCLVIVSGVDAPQLITLGSSITVIGRGESADVQLLNDGLSREHAKVVRASAGIVNIMDLTSTNGTYLNGDRVELAILREGDELQLGPDVVLRFTYAPPACDDASAPAGPARPRAPELTPRELEVARLVAEGMTNAAVAKRLEISERTVTSHLDHIYTRLGINSRAALTRHMADSGLL